MQRFPCRVHTPKTGGTSFRGWYSLQSSKQVFALSYSTRLRLVQRLSFGGQLWIGPWACRANAWRHKGQCNSGNCPQEPYRTPALLLLCTTRRRLKSETWEPDGPFMKTHWSKLKSFWRVSLVGIYERMPETLWLARELPWLGALPIWEQGQLQLFIWNDLYQEQLHFHAWITTLCSRRKDLQLAIAMRSSRNR